MTTLSPETQIRTYACLRGLETRAHAIESLIASLKRRCLHGGAGALSDIISSTADLRWQLRQIAEQAGDLETAVGFVSSGTPGPERKREPEETTGMRGSTDVLSVADLVSLLSSLKKTGTLSLQAADAVFVFEFQAGSVVHAVTNQAGDDLRLGIILVAQNRLTEEQLQASLAVSARANELLGAHLVRSATVSESDLRLALETQVQRIFERAFLLTSARFSFVEGSLSNIAQRARLNTTTMLLEAARHSDELLQRESDPAVAGGARRSALDLALPS